MPKHFLTKLANILTAAIIVLVPFYAFLSVWASTFFGHFTLMRIWDDVLLLILLLIVVYWLAIDKKLRDVLFSNVLFRLIVIFIALVLVTGSVALARHDVTHKALAYGVLVDARFLLWFLAVWIVSMRSNWLFRSWPKLVFWPLAVVATFALLQFFVLPHNFLAHFGYNKATTYVPFITINQNVSTIRVQSFLRGTNELGAYLAMCLGLIAAFIMFTKRHTWSWPLALLAGLALLVSFSRSGWIGAFVAVVAAVWLSFKKPRPNFKFFGSILIVVLILLGFVAIFHKNHGVQDAFFHVSTSSTAKQTSNAGHASAIHSDLHDILHQPLGHGPGTAGQASLYNVPHPYRNSESYFLQIGQELGLIGLALFIAILWFTGKALSLRDDPLAKGLLAGLIGLLVVNLLTYGWVDDTLGFVYWGLVGIALSRTSVRTSEKHL